MGNGEIAKVVTISSQANKDRQLFLLQIVNEHETAIKRFLRIRLANEADRDDIAQEVFTRLCRIENLSDKLSLGSERTRAFLFMTAGNLVRDWYRRRACRHGDAHEPFDENSVADHTASVEERLDKREQLESVFLAINNLRPLCKQAFVMSRFDCMSYREIADHMNITVSMVEKHISNALIAVRRTIDNDPNCDGA